MRVKFKATIVVEYEVDVVPEAYPGAETAEELAQMESGFVENEGDYLVSMMAMDGASTVVDSVTATEV